VHRETPVSDYAIQRALDALHRDIDALGRLVATERAARREAEARARRAEREAAQHRPTVALTLPATRPDLYATAGQGAA
jgi:hypothetical protein